MTDREPTRPSFGALLVDESPDALLALSLDGPAMVIVNKDGRILSRLKSKLLANVLPHVLTVAPAQIASGSIARAHGA